MNSLRIHVATELETFADIWPSLDRPGPSAHFIFQTADMIRLWRHSIGAARHTEPVFVRIANANGPLMLLALGIEQRRGARVLTFLDGGVSDYNAPILFPAAADLAAGAWTEIWSALIAALPPFDAVVFEKMPAFVMNAANPLHALAPSATSPSGHIIPLTCDWDAYVEERLHRPKDSRRKRRRISEAGPLHLRIAASQADVDRIFPVLIAQKTRRYIEKNGADGFDRPGYRPYFSDVTSALFPRGVAHLSALEANGEILAAHWGLVAHNRFYCLMLAHADHPLARYSPGRLLVEDLVQWAYAQNLDAFDLGVGDAEWKRLFRPERLPLSHAAFSVNTLGWTYLEARKLRDRLARIRSEQAA